MIMLRFIILSVGNLSAFVLSVVKLSARYAGRHGAECRYG
jgi:hypothetical protein